MSSTFLGLPTSEIEIIKETGNADFVLVGVPFDFGTVIKPGQRYAPSFVRTYGRELSTFTDNEVNYSSFDPIEDEFKLKYKAGFDLGDVVNVRHLPNFKPEDLRSHLVKTVAATKEVTRKSIFIGGDHSITPNILEGLQLQEFNLVIFDAHLDQDPHLQAKKQAGLLNNNIHNFLPFEDIRSLTYIGVRDHNPFVQDKRLRSVRFYRGYANEEQEILCELDDSLPTFISVDLDVLDPPVFDCVGAPCPNGLQLRELLDLIRAITSQCNVVAADVVEMTVDDNTTSYHARVVEEVLLSLIA